MTEVGFQSKTHVSRLLDRAERGESIVINRHGKPVARLSPVQGSSRDERRQTIAQLKELRSGQTLDGISLRELIDEGRR